MNSIQEHEERLKYYGLFLIDKNKKIAHFPYIERTTSSLIIESVKNWQMLCDYFYSLPIKKDNYKICNKLQQYLHTKAAFYIDNYLELSIEMSSRGLYVYDSYADYNNEQPYFRVAVPNIELKFHELPNIIQNTLKFLTMNDVNFTEDFLINKKL